MIITCQECGSRFVLDEKLIKPTGSKVRCSSCKHVFKVFPETAPPPLEESQAPVAESAPVAASAPTPEPAPAPEPAPPVVPPAAQPPRNLDEGDDLAEELNRELDRLFDLEDSSFDESEPEAETTPAAEAPEPVPEPEEASLDSLDEIKLEDLGLGSLDLSESPDAKGAEDLDLSDLDLSDLDLSLADDPVPALTAEGEGVSAAAGEAPEEALDFADIGLSLDGEEASEAPVFDEDLDFSDLESALEAPGQGVGTDAAAPDEELDFSDLALSLDEGPAPASSLNGTEELELSLDEASFEPASVGAAAGAGHPDEAAGFMELDLDLEVGEEDAMEAPLENSLDEELDLSELEGLLQEEPSADPVAVPEDDDIELELDFDFNDDEKTQEMEPLSQGALDDTDFSDIEAMLEKDDEPLDAAADLNGAVDLELELDLAPEVDEAVAAVPSAENAPQAMDAMAATEPEPEPALDTTLVAASKAKASKTFAADEGRGSGLRIFLTILLVVLLLFAILVGVYAMKDEIRDRTGIAIPTIAVVEQAREAVSALGIPGVSQWVKPEDKDPDGRLQLVTQDVTGRFVASPTLGDLFVITGKVRNNYGTTRHSIRLMGRLFNKGNREIQGKEFFAGNMISDGELATLTMAQVDQRLKTALGKENINARVSPGQLVPFMVIFGALPEDLAEFAVEVRSSQEGAAIK